MLVPCTEQHLVQNAVVWFQLGLVFWAVLFVRDSKAAGRAVDVDNNHSVVEHVACDGSGDETGDRMTEEDAHGTEPDTHIGLVVEHTRSGDFVHTVAEVPAAAVVAVAVAVAAEHRRIEMSLFG